MKKNNRETGAKAEAIACWFLGQQGYDILEQNFYTKVGEIDIIAKEGQTLVFVEVSLMLLIGIPITEVNIWLR